ncbi:hypothetical protein LCL92_29135, partial [Salipiger thiooxidans]|nr:hypothetical protein [Salipiger thiooxidans]
MKDTISKTTPAKCRHPGRAGRNPAVWFSVLPAAAAALGAGARAAQAQVVEEQWDKTFPKSDQVDHRKVSY